MHAKPIFIFCVCVSSKHACLNFQLWQSSSFLPNLSLFQKAGEHLGIFILHWPTEPSTKSQSSYFYLCPFSSHSLHQALSFLTFSTYQFANISWFTAILKELHGYGDKPVNKLDQTFWHCGADNFGDEELEVIIIYNWKMITNTKWFGKGEWDDQSWPLGRRMQKKSQIKKRICLSR